MTKLSSLAGIQATIAGLTVVLDIPLLMLHGQNQNTAAVLLVAWSMAMNFFNFVNPIIWHTSNPKSMFSGIGYCDINIRITIGGMVGLSAALLCLFQTLAGVLDTDRGLVLPTRARMQRRKLRDLALGMVLPVVFMILHYLVEPHRFLVFPVGGCYPEDSSTWVEIIVYIIWPLIFLLAASFYCTLVAVRCVRYKLEFGSILSECSRNKSRRFARLFAMSIFTLVLCLPLEIIVFYYNIRGLLPFRPYSFQAMHQYWARPYYSDRYPHKGIVTVCIEIFVGLVLFIFFGFSRDMTSLVRRGLRVVRIDRLVPISLSPESATAGAHVLIADATYSPSVSGRQEILKTTQVERNSFDMESLDLYDVQGNRPESPNPLTDPQSMIDVEIQGGECLRLDPF